MPTKAGTVRRAKKAVALDAARLRSLLTYDPATGTFLHCRLLRRTGTVRPSGYIEINLLGRVYKAHRLAWLHFYGQWPYAHLDHINGDRGDNRIANLRECTAAQNQQNKALYRSNTSGFRGVTWHQPNRKWVAQISLNGRKKCLGYFSDKSAAAAAYRAAKAEIHSFQPLERGN